MIEFVLAANGILHDFIYAGLFQFQVKSNNCNHVLKSHLDILWTVISEL